MRLIFTFAFLLTVGSASAFASEPCPAFSSNMNDIERALMAHERIEIMTRGPLLSDRDMGKLASVDKIRMKRAIADRINEEPTRATAIGRVSLPTE